MTDIRLTSRGRFVCNVAIGVLLVAFFVGAFGLAGAADMDTYRQMEAMR